MLTLGGVDSDISVVSGSALEVKGIKAAMSNSFGFGGMLSNVTRDTRHATCDMTCAGGGEAEAGLLAGEGGGLRRACAVSYVTRDM